MTFHRLMALCAFVLLCAACAPAAPPATLAPTAVPSATDAPPTATWTRVPTQTPGASPTTEPSPAASDTPAPTVTASANNPAIELLSGPADSCVNSDATQSTVIGFGAVYYDVTVHNFMVASLVAADGTLLGALATAAETRNGEEGWGMYPDAYRLPPNTPVTLTLTVHRGTDADSPVSSISTLTYDCTTGATLAATFERVGE